MNKKDRHIVFMKYGGRCAYCGCQLPEKGWHLDHKEPIRRVYESVRDKDGYWKRVSKGCDHPQLDTVDNAMPACAKCNINKHQDSIEEFRKTIAKYRDSLNLYSVQYQMAKKYGLVEETSKPVVFYFETIES